MLVISAIVLVSISTTFCARCMIQRKILSGMNLHLAQHAQTAMYSVNNKYVNKPCIQLCVCVCVCMCCVCVCLCTCVCACVVCMFVCACVCVCCVCAFAFAHVCVCVCVCVLQ